MNQCEANHRDLICDIGRRIWQRGFCAGNEGNHSVRVSDDRFLCTPTGLSKGFLAPDDIVAVNAAGELVEANANGRAPTSEFKVHRAIYAARPDVHAVIHGHPPHATAFAITDQPLPTDVHPEADFVLGEVPTAPYATPSTQAAADAVGSVIKPTTNTVLMANHGSVTFSDSLLDAYYKFEILEAYCRLLILGRQAGRVRPLTAAQLKELRALKDEA